MRTRWATSTSSPSTRFKILDDSSPSSPRQLSARSREASRHSRPIFLEACRYAKDLGYWSVQAATNGLRFVLEPEFAYQAKEAGLNMVYLQFDGVTNEANAHRQVKNLFDAKRLAIERIFEAGMDIARDRGQCRERWEWGRSWTS
jgi:hypothetical protein